MNGRRPENETLERRRTRIVFPNGNASMVWGFAFSVFMAWATWLSTTLVNLKADLAATTAVVKVGKHINKEE